MEGFLAVFDSLGNCPGVGRCGFYYVNDRHDFYCVMDFGVKVGSIFPLCWNLLVLASLFLTSSLHISREQLAQNV